MAAAAEAAAVHGAAGVRGPVRRRGRGREERRAGDRGAAAGPHPLLQRQRSRGNLNMILLLQNLIQGILFKIICFNLSE